MLHVDKQVGSIKKGKDADLVLWTDNPLSVYAVPQYTIVDGTIYYSLENDLRMRKDIAQERNRIIQKLLAEKKAGSETVPARANPRPVNHCEEDEHDEDSK
jgi:urease alpha subunit